MNAKVYLAVMFYPSLAEARGTVAAVKEAIESISRGDYVIAGVGVHDLAIAFTALDDQKIVASHLAAVQQKECHLMLVGTENAILWPRAISPESLPWIRSKMGFTD